MSTSRYFASSLIILAAVGATALGWSTTTHSVGAAPATPLAAIGAATHIDSILVAYSNVGGPNRQPHAYVYVKDAFGVPVNGATVTGNWSGCTIQSGVSADTQTVYNSSGSIIANGRAHFIGKKKSCWGNNGCDFVFTVTNVVMTGMVYDAASNVATTNNFPCQ